MPPAGPRAFRSSRAVLVRSVDVGESDRRVSLFTEGHGLVTLVGKSARRSLKRFGGTLQKYLLLDAAWTESPGRMPLLGSTGLLESFWGIVEDWEKVRHADYLLELSAALFPQPGPKERAFGVLLEGLRALAFGESPAAVGRRVEISYLSIAGWGPDLSACKRCGRPVEEIAKEERGPFRFISSEGGVLCSNCPGKAGTPLSPGAVKTWKALQASSPAVRGRVRIPDRILEELQPVIHRYLEYHLGFPVRGPDGAPTGLKA